MWTKMYTQGFHCHTVHGKQTKTTDILIVTA